MTEARLLNTMQMILGIGLLGMAALLLIQAGGGSPEQAGFFYQWQPSFSPPSNILTAAENSVASSAAQSVVYINEYQDVPQHGLTYVVAGHQFYVSQIPTMTMSQEVSTGSGFFITSDGYILTNNHVVADPAALYRVDYNGTEVPAQVVYRDSNADIAIVKIAGDQFPALSLGNSSGLSVGQRVVAIGNALGQLTDFATQGKVLALGRNIMVNGRDNTPGETLNGVIETSAKLYPGDSGGPLLDLNGQVVGINTATTVGGGSSAGFSIPINVAKNTIKIAGVSLQ